MFCATMSILFAYKEVIPGDEFLFLAIFQELITLYRRHCLQLQLLYWRYFGLPHLQYRKSGDCSLQLLREGETPKEDYNRADSNDHSAGFLRPAGGEEQGKGLHHLSFANLSLSLSLSFFLS